MITKQESLPQSRLKLTHTATAAQFQVGFEKELELVAKQTKIPGFRPGHAPKEKVLSQVDRRRIEAGALDRLVSLVYSTDLSENKEILPVGNPSVEITEYTAPGPDTKPEEVIATFVVEVDVLPEVEIKGYKKLELDKPAAPKVEEIEVEKVIDYLRKQRASLEPAKEGVAVENGMWVDLGYTGSVDGVSRDDMRNDHHPIVVGEGQLIPGFEENLVGMKAGEEKTFDITFPTEYHSEALADKVAQFTVTVHEIKEVKLPELDKAFADAFGHDSMDMLLDAIRANLHEEKQDEQRKNLDEEILNKLIALTTFELPQSLVEQEIDRQFADSKKRLNEMKFQWDQYLAQTGKTEDELREDMRPQCERTVRIGLTLGKLVELEEIENNNEAPRKAIDRLIEYATGLKK